MNELLTFEKRCNSCGITFSYQAFAPITQPIKCNECYEEQPESEPLSEADDE